MIWGKSQSRSPYKMGLIIPALSFSKDRYKVRMRKKTRWEETEELKSPCPCRIWFWLFPLWIFQTVANLQKLCFLQPRSFDVSSSGKFCSVVYTHGFEAIYQNSSARNCIKMLAAGGWFSPNVLLVPTKEHWRRVGRGFSLLSAKPHILWCHLKSKEAASSSGTCHEMRVC